MDARLLAGVLLIGSALTVGAAAEPKQHAVLVAKGETKATKWRFLARQSRSGLCTAVRTEKGVNDESCGWSRPFGFWTDASGVGSFSAGPATRRVARVRVRFADGAVRTARLYRSPRGLSFRGRFWLVARVKPCLAVGARALDRRGRTVGIYPPRSHGCLPGAPR